MLRPLYEVHVGSLSIDPKTDYVQSLYVHRSMEIPSDHFEGVLRIRDQNLGFSKGDDVSVSLGYSNDLTLVYKGAVDTLDIRFSRVRVVALSSMIKLCTLRLDKLYKQATAGEIVKDLAKTAGVGWEKVSDGIKFPYYAVDSNKNAYEHMVDLGRACGFDIYTTSSDKLVFKEYEPAEPLVMEYGKNIISISRVEQKDLINSVKVFGESPGSDKSHWLVKEPIYADAGTTRGSDQLVLHQRAARDKDAASAIAKATLDRLKSSVAIVLETLGIPKIMLGDTIKIQGVPEETLNGEYQVRGIEHFLSKSAGFTTIVNCRGKGAGTN